MTKFYSAHRITGLIKPAIVAGEEVDGAEVIGMVGTLAEDEEVGEDGDGVMGIAVGVLCDEILHIAILQGSHVPFEYVVADDVPAFEPTFAQIVGDEVDAGVEGYDVRASGDGSECVVHRLVRLFGIIRVYDDVPHLRLREVRGEIVHESAAAFLRRVGQSLDVALDSHEMDGAAVLFRRA